eukprot:TRINITY_DN56826_c0_g1_i2.p1 TRINITY_DN56826_c0_g1~~TRINITY_DN56826_c0_g1_i2.p1  ORF type:complete len:103 (+),score=14.38 TRINITY_DN56826_c0_g1_i2:156-464(+)
MYMFAEYWHLFGVCVLLLPKESQVLKVTLPSLTNTVYKLAVDFMGLVDEMKDNGILIGLLYAAKVRTLDSRSTCCSCISWLPGAEKVASTWQSLVARPLCFA